MCFLSIYVHVACAYRACRGQKRVSDPLEMGLQALLITIVNQILGFEPVSSERAANAPNHCAISQPNFVCYDC